MTGIRYVGQDGYEAYAQYFSHRWLAYGRHVGIFIGDGGRYRAVMLVLKDPYPCG